MVKQRVGGGLHFMEKVAVVRGIEPTGHGVADEMDFVAASSQFHSQLRRDNPGAAISWVTSDADLHKDFLCSSVGHAQIPGPGPACAGAAGDARFTNFRLYVRREEASLRCSDFRAK